MERRYLSTATETRGAAMGLGMRSAFAVAVLAVLVVCLSCSPPLGAAFCTVSEPESCRPGNVKHDCDGDHACGEGRTCVENTRSNGITYAACAIGGKAGFDERCDRDDDASICDGETWIACHGRYHEQAVDCRSLGLVCEQLTRPRIGAFGSETIAKCVESHVADEGCAAQTTTVIAGSRCEGETLLACFGPFVAARVSCPEQGRSCRPTSTGGACVLGEARDSRCIERGTLASTYCDGDVAVLCHDGFRMKTKDCAADGRRCAEVLDEGTSTPAVRCVE